MTEIFDISERIRVLPIVHGSGDFAQEVRRVLLSERFDCVAVPLPPSVRRSVQAAIHELPHVSMVAVREGVDHEATEQWFLQAEAEMEEEGEDLSEAVDALQQLAYQSTDALCGPNASEGLSESDETEGFIDE